MLKQARSPVKKRLSIAWTDSSLSDLDVCFPCIPRHKHGSRIQTHRQTGSYPLWCLSLASGSSVNTGQMYWVWKCVCAWAQSHVNPNGVWIFQCAFLRQHTSLPPSVVLLLSHTCQTGSLSLSLKQSPSPFSWPGSILLSDKKPDSLMTTLYPIVQSAKITILYLYLYWGKPFFASERPGRECFPCWTCPVLPRLWYCCGLPSRRARLPVIGLPFPSHHLSALWIQLQGPKRTTTLQLKRLICPSPSLPPPPPLYSLLCLH